MTYTTTKGDVVHSELSREDAVRVLETHRERNEFAMSLVRQYRRSGKLSTRQWPWVFKIAEEALNPPAQPEPVKGLDLTLVVLMLATAKASGLKYPKLRFDTPDGFLTIYVAGERSRYEDDLMVKSGAYPDSTYHGRIAREDGVFHPSRRCEDWVQTLLEGLAANPYGFVARYGQEGGSCCFCHQTITTEESRTVGYGPVCAEKYGLPWGEKGAPSSAAEMAQAL